ncbi:hypothetical protein AB0E55_00475 [Amycolatopsis keratiniphila]|uniref:hypothetical protein n=1 Tax=Amycolatopsis keratiniphila TaxID=129921 RepID=UPI00340C1AE8
MTEDDLYADFQRIYLPDEFFEGLGRLVFEFSHLDGALGTLLSVQLRPENGSIGALVSQGESTEWLRSRCVNVLEAAGPFTVAEVEELRSLLTQAKGLIVLRNRYVHTSWASYVVDGHVHGYQDRRNSTTRDHSLPLTAFAEAAFEAYKLTAAIYNITDRVSELGSRRRARQLTEAAHAMLEQATRWDLDEEEAPT